MAAFCYKCYKVIWEYKGKKGELEISKDPVLCESCGQWKPVVVPKNDSVEMIVGSLLRGWGEKDNNTDPV